MTRSFASRSGAALSFVALFSCLSAFAQSAVAPRVTQKIDESKLITLKGNVHPAANAINDRGPVADSAPVGHIILMLKRSDEQQRALDATVDELHNSKSDKFHKWLTPQDFGHQFGPADEDVAAVAGWLQSHGFTIEDMPPSKSHITFTGTVGQMRQAFHVDIHHLSVNGEAHQAAMNEPRIPAALAPVVSGFRQLHDFGPAASLHQLGTFAHDPATGKAVKVAEAGAGADAIGKAHANFTQSAGGSGSFANYYEVGPQDFYTIYNENKLLNAGINGAGVTVALLEETTILPADVANFRSLFGLAAYPSSPNSTQGGINYLYGTSSGLGGDTACTAPINGEYNDSVQAQISAVDTEWAGATAPNAILDLVACGNTGTAIGTYGDDLAASHVANYLSSTVAVAVDSYLDCESSAGSSGETWYSNIWEQMAAEGITVVVSSGDAGAMACDELSSYYNGNAATHDPSVNVKASTAYNIAVGGTDLADFYISNGYTKTGLAATAWWNTTNGTGESSAKSYVPEIAWGGFCSNNLFASYLDANSGSSWAQTWGTTYTPEAICNNGQAVSSRSDAYPFAVVPILNVAGSGGGISAYTSIPTWQSVYGVGQYSSSTTMRNLPDVSLFAGNGFWGHFLAYCNSGNGSNCTASSTASFQDAFETGAGGTSFVAPAMAGLIALANQKTGERQGQAAYTLYALGQQEYGTISAESSSIASCSGSGSTTGPSSSSGSSTTSLRIRRHCKRVTFPPCRSRMD